MDAIEFMTGCDFDACVQLAAEKLRAGEAITLTFHFRGRETAHTELGFDTLKRAIANLARAGRLEGELKLIGRRLNAVVTPFK